MKVLMEMERMIKIAKVIFNVDELGVNYNDLLILSAVNNGNNTLRKISDFLLTDKSPVHRKLNKLIDDGMIFKEGKMHSLKFHLTESGKDVLMEADKILEFIKTEDLKGLGQAPKPTLRETLAEFSERLAPIYFKG